MLEKNEKHKQTIIIFEGHDMSGKTTIAKALSETLNIPYFKHHKAKAWWDPIISLLYSSDPIIQLLEQTGFSVIIDRFHASEYAYSEVYNRRTLKDEIMKIDQRFANMNTIIVICEKRPEAYEDDDQNIIDKDKYTSLKEAYKRFARYVSSCKTVILDTTDQDLQSQIKLLVDVITK